ncbi:PIN domain-containing protein, partial [Micromonospora sp. 4G55]|uniref:PIN domain-containing protein n=1 Tax=Micromonospora sp. 4G55 TaxID=2806102 RepID=UPI001A5A7C30
MIVLLDATVFVKDPMCSGVAWRVLAHRMPAWSVDVRVTEVVIAEAVAGFGRRIDEALVGLDRWSGKHAGALGLSAIASTAHTDISAFKAAYEDRLHGLLRSARVEVIPPADVPHMDMVNRATKRRKPCDQSGNGYRDTLNWLTLMKVANEDPEREVVWVTDNTRDFADESGTGLHPQLVDELRAAGAERVRWMPSLQALALELATRLGSGDNFDLSTAESQLRDEAVAEYLGDNIFDAILHHDIDPRTCGLPLETDEGVIVGHGYPRDVEIAVRRISSDEAVAEFSAVLDTSIAITPLPGMSFSSPEVVVLPNSPTVTGLVEKPLIYRGIMTLGDYDRPVAVELARIEATPDDPGVSAWAAREAYERVREEEVAVRHAVQQAQSQEEAARRAAEAALRHEEAIRRGTHQVHVREEAARRAAEAALRHEEAVRRATHQLNVREEAARRAAEAALRH